MGTTECDGMRQTLLSVGVVCCLFFSGCLGFATDEEEAIRLNVVVNEELLVLETVYEEGEWISSTIVTFEFDFSGSTSDVAMQTFGLTMDDGRAVSVEANVQQHISIDVEHHGMYTVSLYAVDSSGTNVSQDMQIVVEHLIHWTESDTGNPQSLYFDATPGNEGPAPLYVLLNSTVSNPSPLLEVNGRDVDVEWGVLNADGKCMGHRELIENGGSYTWNTLHFAPIEMHEVELTIHEGQDSVNVDHRIELRYTE